MYPSPLIPNPELLGYSPFDVNTTATAGRFTVRLDPVSGTIGYLYDNATGQTWAGAGSTLGAVHYQSYDGPVREALLWRLCP